MISFWIFDYSSLDPEKYPEYFLDLSEIDFASFVSALGLTRKEIENGWMEPNQLIQRMNLYVPELAMRLSVGNIPELTLHQIERMEIKLRGICAKAITLKDSPICWG